MAIGITAKRVPINTAPLDYLDSIISDMDGERVCVVVPTARNIRTITKKLYKTIDVFPISEFTAYANYATGINIPKQLRPYYLKKSVEQLTSDDKIAMFKASDSELISKLTYFIKTSSGILSFYRELSAEMIAPEQLLKAGVYTDYETQITVLSKLWQIYTENLAKDGLSDEWETRKNAVYRSEFIDRYDKFVFLISGFLTKYEQQQLKTLATQKDVTLIFNYAGELNKQHRLYEDYLDIEIEKQPINPLANSKLQIIEHESYLAEFEYITNEIFSLNKNNGIDFSKMAVVMPDEQLNSYFLHLDKYNLFDISAGKSIENTQFYSILSQLIEMHKDISTKNKIPIQSVINLLHTPIIKDDDTENNIKSLQKLIGDNFIYINLSELDNINFFKKIASIILTANEKDTLSYYIKLLSKYMKSIKSESHASDTQVVHDTITHIEMLTLLYKNIDDELTFDEAFAIIMQELNSVKQKTPKGKVAVIGILESRNNAYDAIFIPSLNSDVFPPNSQKDLFLNTELRNQLGLPTYIDREDLLKNYLLQIISQSKFAFISYINNKNSRRRSSFVEELLINYTIKVEEYDISNPHLIDCGEKIKYKKSQAISIKKSEQIIEKILSTPLSASRFNIYANCSLRYYLQYFVRIESPVEADEEISPMIIGTVIHNTLKIVDDKKISPLDKSYVQELKKTFIEQIEVTDAYKYSELEQYKMEDIVNSFDNIAFSEKERLENGFKTIAREKEYTVTYKGFTLKSTIDKVEQSSDGYNIVDYKYKSDIKNINNIKVVEELNDWQIPFYAILFKLATGKDVNMLYHYDLKKNFKLFSVFPIAQLDDFQQFFDNKLGELISLNVPFTQTNDIKRCKYCDYKVVCGRNS